MKDAIVYSVKGLETTHRTLDEALAKFSIQCEAKGDVPEYVTAQEFLLLEKGVDLAPFRYMVNQFIGDEVRRLFAETGKDVSGMPPVPQSFSIPFEIEMQKLFNSLFDGACGPTGVEFRVKLSTGERVE